MFIIAFRNIWLNKRRTLFTLASISAGGMALLLALGFMRATFDGLEANSISEVGHLEIFRKGYSESKDIIGGSVKIQAYDSLLQRLNNIPHIEFITPRISFNGIVGNEYESKTMIGEAFIPENERKIGNGGFFAPLVSGKYFRTTDEDGAMLGQGLAKKLRVREGDDVTMLANTSRGSYNSVSVRVKGIVQYSVPEYNDSKVCVNLATAQQLLAGPGVDCLVVMLDDQSLIDETKTALTTTFTANAMPYEVKTWEELSPYYQSVKNLYVRIYWFLLILIGIIIVFSIVNNVMMSVYERYREIGTLRAIGTQRTTITLMFVYESLLLGTIGWICASLLAYGAAWYITTLKVVMPPPPAKTYSYILSFHIALEYYLWILVLCLGSAMVSSIAPAVKCGRLKIIEALKYI